MRPSKLLQSANNTNHARRRPDLLYLLCAAAIFSLVLFAVQSSFFTGNQRLNREHFGSYLISTLASSNAWGLGLRAHIIDHCKMVLKFLEDTNSTWYRNMTTVLTREYLILGLMAG